MSGRPLRVAFLHPNLGIGGAERLVVDAAVALQRRGHDTTIFTGRHDPRHAFRETRDGTLRVRALWRGMPGDVGGRLRAPLAILRTALCAGAMTRQGGRRFDLVVCDVVSHVVPLARAFSGAPVLFYCHYPDLLLTPARAGAYARYRRPLDWLEGVGLRRADRIAVNSEHTAGIVRATLPGLSEHTLHVVHPGVDTHRFRPATTHDPAAAGPVMLALGRIARDKNLALAVRTLAALRDRLAPGLFSRVRLVVAGALDRSRPDAVRVLRDLEALARTLGVEGQLVIRTSVSDAERLRLLEQARCLVHPHPCEHFGIAPIEAMAAGRPVVAVARGGPLETMADGVTGYLRQPEPEAFAEAAALLLESPRRAAGMGEAGQRHAEARFSLEAFGERFERLARETVADNRRSPTGTRP
jgi:alpha-1,3/alpha-1,6-mannosyltransferase